MIGGQMAPWLVTLITVITTLLASSGFWSLILYRVQKHDARDDMLKGLGHDRIMTLAMEYLERGHWITEDEYENLVVSLYEPYSAMGGNGSAKRAIDEVKQQLHIVKTPPEDEGNV